MQTFFDQQVEIVKNESHDVGDLCKASKSGTFPQVNSCSEPLSEDATEVRGLPPFGVANNCKFPYEIASYVKMRDAKPRLAAGSGACLSFHLGYEKTGVDLMYDIAVVGAGPAGATFARLVADRYKVLVVDAFSSAMLLATAVSDSLHGFEKRYGEATARLRRNIFLKNMKSHFIFNPSLRKLVMRSGLSALDLHLP